MGKRQFLPLRKPWKSPSGHNVGQRFARLAAAAEGGVPFLYFSPYVAKKHGGSTAGPRYVNVRLFHALDVVERTRHTAVTTINWPVDRHFEVRRDSTKDADVRDYLATFLELYASQPNLRQLNKGILLSAFHRRMITERKHFIKTSISNPEQYDSPPRSVEIIAPSEFRQRHGQINESLDHVDELVTYRIGTNNLRSDPYTGMSMLYRYLYVLEYPSRALVLWFPNITDEMWRAAASNPNRKDVRLFRIAADAILFKDKLVLCEDL